MSFISRANADALISVEVSKEIFEGVTEQSKSLKLMTRLQNMTKKQFRIPVLSVLPSAYFVGGTVNDGDRKQTTSVEWDNVYITAEEIAVIVPIQEAVLDDADYDIWGEIKPKIEEAFAKVIDEAVLFGVSRPTTWPTGIVPTAITKTKTVVEGSGDDIYDDILGESGIFAVVEQSGFDVAGHIGDVSMKAKLRGLRASTGEPIFMASVQTVGNYTLYGTAIEFCKNGAWDKTDALLLSGDFSKAVYSIRQDLTYKVLDQAIIQDAEGEILYNLAQQDMVGLRVVMRLGWALPNPAQRLVTDASERYPFAVLTPAVPTA